MSYNNSCLFCGNKISFENFGDQVQFALDEVVCDSSYFVPCFCKSCKPDDPAPDILCKMSPYSGHPTRPSNMYPRFRYRISTQELRDACTRMNSRGVLTVFNTVNDLLRE